jgi:hypothetical protein
MWECLRYIVVQHFTCLITAVREASRSHRKAKRFLVCQLLLHIVQNIIVIKPVDSVYVQDLLHISLHGLAAGYRVNSVAL